MKRYFLKFAFTILITGICVGCYTRPSNRPIARQLAAGRAPEALNLDVDDKLADAISHARETVDEFVVEVTSAYDKDAAYAFRAMMGEHDIDAHVWVEVDPGFVQTRDQLIGKVMAVPPEWKMIQPGQGLTQNPELVYDWRIVKDGVVRGAFTTRAIRKLMTDAQRRAFDKRTGFKFD